MVPYIAVSVDMFQTLVNVQTRIPFIWSRILGDAYTPDAAKRYAAMLFGLAIPRFSTFNGPTEFRTTKSIFAELNRNGIAWEHELKPDYTVRSLGEVPAILAAASERSAG